MHHRIFENSPERSMAAEHISGHPVGCSGPSRVARINLESHTEIVQKNQLKKAHNMNDKDKK